MKWQLSLLAWVALASYVHAHSCIHDAVQAGVQVVNGPQVYQGDGRRLDVTTWSPVRIQALYLNLAGDGDMTPALVNFVEGQLIPEAVQRWTELLSVMPVVGALFAHRQCDSYYTTTPATCANLVAGPTCDSNDGVSVPFDAQYVGADTYYNNQGTAFVEPATGSGLAAADFGMFVTAQQTASCGSGGSGTLAYAYSCQRDSFDRPTWGRINLCPQALSTDTAEWDKQLKVAMHEMAHALGFSSTSWPLFRGSDAPRTPRTPRDPMYPFQPAAQYKVTYTCNGQTSSQFVPADTTVAYFNERGMSCTYPTGIATPANCVYKFVTPAAIAAAQYYFDCPSLNGAELENQLTTPCDLQGSHWEQRIFSQELMASYAQHVMLVTPLTLAVFEDSGWYQANYTATDWLRPQADYGFRQGCGFATGKCLTTVDATVGAGTPPHFYGVPKSTNGHNAVCSTDLRAVAYATLYTHQDPVPTQYQYFTDLTKSGDNPNVFDYCPAVQAYSNGACADPASASINAQYFGETYGSTSACMASSLVWTGITPANGVGAACYKVQCVSPTSVTITITKGAGQAVSSTVTCNAGDEGTGKTAPGYANVLYCPDVDVLCGDLLQYAGTGIAASTTNVPWPFPQAVDTTLPSPSVSPSAPATPSITPSATRSQGSPTFSAASHASLPAAIVCLVAASLLAALSRQV